MKEVTFLDGQRGLANLHLDLIEIGAEPPSEHLVGIDVRELGLESSKRALGQVNRPRTDFFADRRRRLAGAIHAIANAAWEIPFQQQESRNGAGLKLAGIGATIRFQ